MLAAVLLISGCNKSAGTGSSKVTGSAVDQRLRFHLGAKSLKGDIVIPENKHAVGLAVLAFEGGSPTPRGILAAQVADRKTTPSGQGPVEFMWTVEGKTSHHTFTWMNGQGVSSAPQEDGWLESAGSSSPFVPPYPRWKSLGDYEVLGYWQSWDDVSGQAIAPLGVESAVTKARKSMLLVSKVLATEADAKAFSESIHLMR